MYVDFSLLITESGGTLLAEDDRPLAITEFVVNLADVGPDGDRKRRKRQKERDASFEQFKQEQKALRELIENVISPVKEQTEPVVVTQDNDQVEVLSADGRALSIPVPGAFSVSEVAQMVAQALEAAKIESMIIMQRQEALRTLEQAKAGLAKIIKRRRDDELLLLLS